MMRPYRKCLGLLVILATIGCEQMTDDIVTERDRVEAVIGEVLNARGALFEELPANNVAAVGPLAFKYRPQKSQIVVSALIAEFTAWTLFPDRRPKLEQTVSALQDPAIGGLFQTDEAQWMFDRETGKLSLGYELPVTATATDLANSATSLERLSPEWSLSWMGAVADIVHEGAPLPSANVTLENNPYR